MARQATEDLGRATISPRKNIVVGSNHTFRITYAAGRKGLALGGAIRIIFPGSHSWSKPQAFHVSHYAGYVSALSDDGTCLVRAQNFDTGYSGNFGKLAASGDAAKAAFNGIVVTVVKGRLAPGRKLRVLFGDIQNGKGFGANVSHKYVRALRNLSTFEVSVDPEGRGKFRALRQQPEIELVPDRTESLEIHAPSVVAAGERLSVHAKACDRFFNPTPAYSGPVKVSWPGTPQRREVFRKSRIGTAKFRGAAPARPGVFRIEVRDDAGLRAKSNPCAVVHEPPFRIYWGELHHHTSFSDDNAWGSRMFAEPKETCAYARDVSGLDFVAITDHHNWYKPRFHDLIRRAWDAASDCAAAVTREGQFVVFPGMEFRCDRGDTNVICERSGEPYCSPKVDSVTKVWEVYRGRRVLTIPHFHPQEGTEQHWQPRCDELERLVEVCSNHGRYEFVGNVPRHPQAMTSPLNTLHYMLQSGRRIGVCCGSDDHQGQPGNLHLTAVLAAGRTRREIFDALRARRCYGTTHARILLDFHVNGAWMGEEIAAPRRSARRIAGSVHGTAPLLSVEVIRNGQEVHSVYNPGESARFDFEDAASGRGTDWYYLRVLQADSEMAWSSPIWVGARP